MAGTIKHARDLARDRELENIVHNVGEKCFDKSLHIRDACRLNGPFPRDDTFSRVECRDLFRSLNLPNSSADFLFDALELNENGTAERSDLERVFAPIMRLHPKYEAYQHTLMDADCRLDASGAPVSSRNLVGTIQTPHMHRTGETHLASPRATGRVKKGTLGPHCHDNSDMSVAFNSIVGQTQRTSRKSSKAGIEGTLQGSKLRFTAARMLGMQG